MSDDPLYRRDLLRLAADATGSGRLEAPDAAATLRNPACGDQVTVELRLDGRRIAVLAHDTRACVLAQASAALLAGRAPGADRSALEALRNDIRAFLGGAPAPPGYDVFAGAASHPGRHVCVLLPLETALKALEAAEPGGMGTEGQD